MTSYGVSVKSAGSRMLSEAWLYAGITCLDIEEYPL
jgi:hypothetical protein